MSNIPQSKVAIVKGKPPLDQAAVREMVRQAVESVCDLDELVKPGDNVVIKPNLFAPLPAPATTDPRVVEADVLINLPVMKSHSLCLVTLERAILTILPSSAAPLAKFARNSEDLTCASSALSLSWKPMPAAPARLATIISVAVSIPSARRGS